LICQPCRAKVAAELTSMKYERDRDEERRNKLEEEREDQQRRCKSLKETIGELKIEREKRCKKL
jgi:hypothetical protein